MIGLLTVFVLCIAKVLGALSVVTICANTYNNVFVVTCSATAYYQNPVCVNVAFADQSSTNIVTSLWSGASSATTTSSVRVLSTQAFVPGKGVSYDNGCSILYFASATANVYSLTTFYVTSYVPFVTTTVSTSLTETVSETVTSSLLSTVTESVCEGSDGIVTRFTTGPVAGTSTITSCASS